MCSQQSKGAKYPQKSFNCADTFSLKITRFHAALKPIFRSLKPFQAFSSLLNLGARDFSFYMNTHIPVLLLVMVLIFALIRFIPGDPADVMLGARATEESRAMLHAKMGIDKPIYEQFFLFMKNCLRLDFGESILSGEPVSQILARRFQVTASLTGMTALFTMLLALPIGYFSGVNKHNAAGKAINTSALVVMAVPAFWVGILLMYFFGLKLHWFPISGWGDTFGEHVWSLILPAFTQSLGISALLIRNMQNEVAQIFTIDYVDFARSKGLAPMRVRVWYILRNVMISTTTLFSIGIASMLGGSVIIETVFSLPGLGSLIMSSILARDYPAVQGCVILFAVIIMAVNLLTDILYSVLDPRVKLQ